MIYNFFPYGPALQSSVRSQVQVGQNWIKNVWVKAASSKETREMSRLTDSPTSSFTSDRVWGRRWWTPPVSVLSRKEQRSSSQKKLWYVETRLLISGRFAQVTPKQTSQGPALPPCGHFQLSSCGPNPPRGRSDPPPAHLFSEGQRSSEPHQCWANKQEQREGRTFSWTAGKRRRGSGLCFYLPAGREQKQPGRRGQGQGGPREKSHRQTEEQQEEEEEMKKQRKRIWPAGV